MGNACVSEAETTSRADMDRSRTIDSALFTQQREEKSTMKILLLGAAEGGKTTVLKQMKILHKNGFTEAEKAEAVHCVRCNTMQALKQVVSFCRDQKVSLGDRHQPLVELLLSQHWHPDDSTRVDLKLRGDVELLWREPAVQRAVERSDEYFLLDSCRYFCSEVGRTFADGYEPTDQDVLRARKATSGVVETLFRVENTHFKMFDVGGQRGERKKWIHCFENVRCILFIASLSEYNQVLAEDNSRNRMLEGLTLFEALLNLSWFRNVPFILFLNKADIFLEKIPKIDLGTYFPQYLGGANTEAAMKFVTDLYLSKQANPDKKMYVHVTTATNTDNIAAVWRASKKIIVDENIARAGIKQLA